MIAHYHRIAGKFHILRFQQIAHQCRRREISLPRQFSISIYNAMTWNSHIVGNHVQCIADYSRRAAKPQISRNSAICRHFPQRYLSHYIVDPHIEILS